MILWLGWRFHVTDHIITGDDFGWSHEINEAVEAQYLAGRLTQASLMIHGRHVEEARRIARRHPGLGVGLHLTLCTGSRVGRTALTDAQGNFEPSPAVAGMRYFANRSLHGAIRAEIEEQFGRFLAAGFPAIYWDGHTHLHLHPAVFAESLPVALAHGFRAVRLMQTTQKGALGWIFNRLSAAARRKLRGTTVAFADRTLGLSQTGRVDDAIFAQMQQAAASANLAEIYYHPGMDGPQNGALLPEVHPTNWHEILKVPANVDDSPISG